MTMDMRTKAQELMELAEDVSSGPWESVTISSRVRVFQEVGGVVCQIYGVDGSEETAEIDGRFIAMARNNAPAIAQAYLDALEFIESMANFNGSLIGVHSEQNNAGVKMTAQVVRKMARDFLGKVSE